ncbi:hypothetical protein cypCar_00001854 [Cyprinus carpio]|nr:hypothetical protein cypCar_00001854 [Cyprinus carpio]
MRLTDIEAQCDQSEKIKSIETRIAEPVQTASEPEEPETVKLSCQSVLQTVIRKGKTHCQSAVQITWAHKLAVNYHHDHLHSDGNFVVYKKPSYPGYATDATVVLLLGFTFFIIPAHKPNAQHYAVLLLINVVDSCDSGLDNVEVMPWEISLLLGGGFALAEGTKAKAIGVNPVYMLIPTALCVSFSFLLPVSNTPNAIVFTYGHLTSMDMVSPYGHVHPTAKFGCQFTFYSLIAFCTHNSLKYGTDNSIRQMH